MKVHQLINDRKSTRAFSNEAISDDVLVTLFEAARLAPSSMNEQPWRFILAKKDDKESFERMLECLKETNSSWAKHAAVLILTVAKKIHTSFDKPNAYAWHDVGLAIGNLSLQAMSMNIFMRQMGGFYPEVARKNFDIPDYFEPVSIIALGYKGDPELLPPTLQDKEFKSRTRLPLTELVYKNSFGEKINWK
jgi:nitroreductase